jgi:hypothetical protein
MHQKRQVVEWLVGSFLIGAIAALLLFTWYEGHRLTYGG